VLILLCFRGSFKLEFGGREGVLKFMCVTHGTELLHDFRQFYCLRFATSPETGVLKPGRFASGGRYGHYVHQKASVAISLVILATGRGLPN
jgi:hypothetical protein